MTWSKPRIEPTTSPTPGGCATSYATDVGLITHRNKDIYLDIYIYCMCTDKQKEDKQTSKKYIEMISIQLNTLIMINK